MKTEEIFNILITDDIVSLNEWLPNIVIDVHIHCWRRQQEEELINTSAVIPGTTFNYFSWELHKRMLDKLFPNITYQVALMGFPFLASEYDCNEYIFDLSSSSENIIPIFLCIFNRDMGNIRKMLEEKYSGLKMYATREQKHTDGTKIIHVFPEDVLKIVDQISGALILHLPRDIFTNLEELKYLAKKYPRVTFTIAHMGNVYCYSPNVRNAYNAVAQHPNILFDTAMVADSQVIAEALASVGSKRIMFGSDAPISYIRGRHVDHGNQGIRVQSTFPFNWVDKDEHFSYQEEAKDFKLFHFNIITAIREAIEVSAVKDRKEVKDNVFYRNATLIFQRR